MSARHATLLAALSAIWGGSYLLIKYALEGFSAAAIVSARSLLASAVLFAVLRSMGAAGPALADLRGRPRWALVLGVSAVAAPFLLITFGEHVVPSGLTAVLISPASLFVALLAPFILPSERIDRRQGAGMLLGLAGVALVVGERASAGTASVASVLAVVWALLCVTAGTLYQRQFCAGSDLRAAVCIHLAATALLMLPLGVAVEGFAIAWSAPIALALAYHVVLGSIGAFSILHLLMRHGQATGVTSLLYLTPPVAALVEWAVYGVAPTLAMWAGMAIACVGVAMATVNAGRFARGALVEERS